MKLDVRSRVAVWLLLVGLVVVAASTIVLDRIESRLEVSAQESLLQLVELERDRLLGELGNQRADVETIADDDNLIGGLRRTQSGLPLPNALLETILGQAQFAGQDIAGLRLANRDGIELDRTSQAQWRDPLLEAEAMEQRRITIGPATSDGTVGVISPVESKTGEVIGALTVEMQLTPILWLSNRYESFGDTSEAFVYQRVDGSCQLLTDLRYERSAAFSALSGDYATVCDTLPEDQFFRGNDYRNVETHSAWADLDSTSWVVVVKMDDSEVFEPLDAARQTMLAGGAVVAVLMVAGWFALVRPIGTRLARAAQAAEQLASGDYQAFIEDGRSDEIGRMSESINCLAKDLTIDIERREKAEARLRVRADYDELTGLWNRGRMMAELREASGHGHGFSVIFLDLDGFKQINDSYGHSIGDEVLRLVASRIQEAIAGNADRYRLARWGGDEFVVMCLDAPSSEEVEMIDLLDAHFDEPFRSTAGEHRVGVSIGRADTTDGHTIEAVMSAADASMYRAKRRGDERSPVSPRALKFVEDALADDRVMSYMQPLVSAHGDDRPRIVGAEALVRVRRQDGSMANPGSFLPGLGASEQSLALDLRVLERAVAAVSDWRRRGRVGHDFALSANFGAAAMADPRLADKIAAILDRHGLTFGNLVVEIPETAREVDLQTIERLRNDGASIAIDDVGCMFSNLERLVDIPADYAKIDRRWVPADAADSERAALLGGLVQQCQMLDLTVVVEGVETEVQLKILRNLGVERVQGFFFGKPVELSEFEQQWTTATTTTTATT